MTGPGPGALFVASGGARGITAACVAGMARRYRCRFILLGRTALAPEPAWAAGCDGEAELKGRIAEDLRRSRRQATPPAIQRVFDSIRNSREVRRTLEELAAAGSTAEYVTADVSDRDGLERALTPALQRLGPATGLIHGAGAISDKPIERKTCADFDAVYGPKVRGLENLLACLPAASLEWAILFSSAAGFFGNAGQADYAMANEILNRAAHRIAAANPRCRVLSLNWGAWDGGMVTPERRSRFEELGVQVIPRASGVEALISAFEDRSAPTQALVGQAWRQRMPEAPGRTTGWRIRRRLSAELAPCVLDHVIGQHPVLPAVCAASWLANACEQVQPGLHFREASDLRVLKGVVFDGTLPEEYVVHLDVLERTADEARFRGTVKSAPAAGKERFHYTGQCVLRRTPPERPRLLDVDLTEDANAIDGRSLYREGLLFHGPAFQGIERVLNASEARITMRCRLAAVTAANQGVFPVRTYNPYLADVQLQSVLVWALMMRGVGGHPLHLEGIELFTPPPFDETVYVTTIIRRAGRSAIIGDSSMHDADGWVYMRHTGAELTPSVAADGLLAGART